MQRDGKWTCEFYVLIMSCYITLYLVQFSGQMMKLFKSSVVISIQIKTLEFATMIRNIFNTPIVNIIQDSVVCHQCWCVETINAKLLKSPFFAIPVDTNRNISKGNQGAEAWTTNAWHAGMLLELYHCLYDKYIHMQPNKCIAMAWCRYICLHG